MTVAKQTARTKKTFILSLADPFVFLELEGILEIN